MKTFKISFALLSFMLIWGIQSSQAQDYSTAAGLRLGTPLSISIKQFVNESMAIEGYVGTRGSSSYRWTNISGAVLYHEPLLDLSFGNLTYYYGGGGSVFLWRYTNSFFGGSATTFGIQGYGGFDFTLTDVPISITLDWIPTFFIGEGFYTGFRADYGTLGVRYILK